MEQSLTIKAEGSAPILEPQKLSFLDRGAPPGMMDVCVCEQDIHCFAPLINGNQCPSPLSQRSWVLTQTNRSRMTVG